MLSELCGIYFSVIMARQEYLIYNNSARITSVFIKIIEEESSVYTLNLFENGYVFNFLKGLGKLFYLIHPSETTFEDHRDVPPYFADVSFCRIFCN